MGLTKNLGWLSKYITADSAGKIGIGTASPNYGLNVVSSDITLSGIVSNRFIGIRKTSNTLPGYLGLLGGDNGDNAKIIGYNSSGTQTFEINASTSATYFNGGNILIGTTTDAGTKLNVIGTGKFTGSGFGSNGIEAYGANGGSGVSAVAGGSAGSAIYGTTGDASSFGGTFQNTTSGIALRVLGNSTITGNLGIGTGVPGSKVHIEGLFGTSGDALRIQNTTGYTTGNRANIDFWFKSAAWTNARTAQISAVTTDSYWPNTDISFSVNANTSATALKQVMRIRQDGAISNNGVLTQYISGSANVDTTFYFDFVAYPSTVYKILAGITHWNAGYGAYKESLQFNDAYTTISELPIVNHTSGNGGMWSISRPDNVTLRVTHTAGTFAGGANFWIQVIGV